MSGLCNPEGSEEAGSPSCKPVSKGGEISISHDRFQVQTRTGVCWEEREQPFPQPDNQRVMGISDECCGQQAKIAPNPYNLALVVTRKRRGKFTVLEHNYEKIKMKSREIIHF